MTPRTSASPRAAPAPPPAPPPIPSADELMSAVSEGAAACDRWSALFARWPVEQGASQVVINGLDPLLLEVVLGVPQARRWLPAVRHHYAELQSLYPGPFADVERVWQAQRARWREYVDEGGESEPAGGGAAAPSTSPSRPLRASASRAGAPARWPRAACPPTLRRGRRRRASPGSYRPLRGGGRRAATPAGRPGRGARRRGGGGTCAGVAARGRRAGLGRAAPPVRPPVAVPPAAAQPSAALPRPQAPPLPARPDFAAATRPGASSLAVRGREFLEAARVSAEAPQWVTDAWISGGASETVVGSGAA